MFINTGIPLFRRECAFNISTIEEDKIIEFSFVKLYRHLLIRRIEIYMVGFKPKSVRIATVPDVYNFYFEGITKAMFQDFDPPSMKQRESLLLTNER